MCFIYWKLFCFVRCFKQISISHKIMTFKTIIFTFFYEIFRWIKYQIYYRKLIDFKIWFLFTRISTQTIKCHKNYKCSFVLFARFYSDDRRQRHNDIRLIDTKTIRIVFYRCVKTRSLPTNIIVKSHNL